MGYEESELDKAKHQLVIKDNRLIQNIVREGKRHEKYDLTANEQKALAYIISKIKKPEDGMPAQLKYTLDLKEFCKICNIEYDYGGGNTSWLKETLGRLASNGIWITNENGKNNKYFQWIHSPEIDTEKGTITVYIPETSMPYLYDLHDNFTQYELDKMLCLKGKYSMALFELLQSNAYKGEFRISVQDYRDYMGLEDSKYNQYKDLRKNVIDKPLKEINENPTGITAKYKAIRNGRNYKKLQFDVRRKDGIEQYEARKKLEGKKLNGKKKAERSKNSQ